ncbi:hypothetical protein LDENG_00176780 [Lucifuga dentata]|nr:hypothetical protein LDENG_00176780 [Lucifuga dentata]
MENGSEEPLAKQQLSTETSSCNLNIVQNKSNEEGRFVVMNSSELRNKQVYSVQAITQTITEGTQSELEKLRAIWIWLCHFIEYDVNGYLGLTEKLCSPQKVMESGRGVCSGYSSVCLQMCREAGIKCKEVSGHGKGIGYRQGQSYQNTKSSHMWNAVCLRGHWYLLDACWGAGKVDLDNKIFTKWYDDFYFLTDPEEFINSHCPDDPLWQLLDSPISLEEFEKRVWKTSEFFRMGLTLLNPKHFLLVTDNGEASIYMTFSQSVEFTYQVFQRNDNQSKEINCACGLLTITQDTMRLQLLPPTSSTYDVRLFARPGNTSGTFGWVCSFLLECPQPRQSETLPENPFLSWGLHRNAAFLGVKGCNHGSEPTVYLEIHVVLSKEQYKTLVYPLSRHFLLTHIGFKVTISVVLPEAGVYMLRLYAKSRSQQDFSPMCDFVLKNSSQASLPPFPCMYTAWQKGSVLFEPRAGLLAPMSWVRFRVRVPWAQKVSVLGEQTVHLELSRSRVWEGKVFTGEKVKQLKVAASRGGGSTDMSVIMCFDVLSQKNVM